MAVTELSQRQAASFKKFAEMLLDESDRGCVIVSVSILDEILEDLIKGKLLHSLGKKDELFDDASSSLSTLSTKIDLAYRLGLITKNARTTFHIARKMRNSFAHISDPKTFESSSVKSRVLEIFKLNKEIMDAFSSVLSKELPETFGDAEYLEIIGLRSAYTMLIAGIASQLQVNSSSIERLKQPTIDQ